MAPLTGPGVGVAEMISKKPVFQPHALLSKSTGVPVTECAAVRKIARWQAGMFWRDTFGQGWFDWVTAEAADTMT
jgi:hypothetical protein